MAFAWPLRRATRSFELIPRHARGQAVRDRLVSRGKRAAVLLLRALASPKIDLRLG
jgi:hypothetical protein